MVSEATQIQTPADPSARPRHPLKAWRETQTVFDEKRKLRRPMKISDAARGIGVAYQAWQAWEKYGDEPDARIPTDANMRAIFLFTKGQVRPDHFFQLPDLRDQLADREANAA